MIFILVFTFVLGIVIGSFLNVVAYRYNTGLSIVSDRSKCFSCNRNLTWYELIPIASFLIQKGKCRKCGSKISLQYPLVEFFVGCIFIAIILRYPLVSVSVLLLDLLFMVIWSVLTVIFIYDLRHKIIPDGLSFIFGALSLLSLFIEIHNAQAVFVFPSLLNLLAGPILFLPFFSLWFFSKGTWMGLGDAKLAVGIGWLLGLIYGVSAIVLAFWIGALFAIGLLILQKTLSKTVFRRFALSMGIEQRIMKSEIPFAPFLILGMLILFFYHIDIVGLSLFF